MTATETEQTAFATYFLNSKIFFLHFKIILFFQFLKDLRSRICFYLDETKTTGHKNVLTLYVFSHFRQ